MSAAHEVVPPGDALPVLPDYVRPLSHQVAGHVYNKKKAKLGFLECGNGTLLKPLQSGGRGECELDLYHRVFDPACTCPVLLQLRPLIPRYLGTYTLPEHPQVTYLHLEDLTHGFTRPCVADVKLGRRTYDPLAGPEKVAREEAKYPPARNLGFQLRGMRVYDEGSDSFTTLGKEYLRSFKEDTINQAFVQFFSGARGVRHEAVRECLTQLRPILAWFETQQQLSFYASSILLIYDAQPQLVKKKPHTNAIDLRTSSQTWNNLPSILPTFTDKLGCNVRPTAENQTTDTETCRTTVRLIDFAHVFPVDHIDDNNLFGIQKLVGFLEGLLKQ